jgi:hypothetical protein
MRESTKSEIRNRTRLIFNSKRDEANERKHKRLENLYNKNGFLGDLKQRNKNLKDKIKSEKDFGN